MKKSTLRYSIAAVLVAACAAQAPGQITFNDTLLGNGNFVWDVSGLTLTASASDGGSLGSIGSGEFAGLWVAQELSASGTYTLAFSQPVISVEFAFDAMSGVFDPVETFSNFAISSGTPTLAYTNVNFTSFDGSTVTVDAGADFGAGVMKVTGPGAFDSLSFTHAQNILNNGSVIERVTVHLVPEPAGILLLGSALVGLFAMRRADSSR